MKSQLYSEVQWNPVESSGVHVDYVGDGKVLEAICELESTGICLGCMAAGWHSTENGGARG